MLEAVVLTFDQVLLNVDFRLFHVLEVLVLMLFHPVLIVDFRLFHVLEAVVLTFDQVLESEVFTLFQVFVVHVLALSQAVLIPSVMLLSAVPKNCTMDFQAFVIPWSRPSMMYWPCSFMTLEGLEIPNAFLKPSMNGLKICS